MASLLAASASAARRRLPILMSFYARLSSTTCYFERRGGEGEKEKEGRSEGENLGKTKKNYGTRRTFLQIPGYNESEIKSVSQPLTAEASDISPKPQTADIFVRGYDKDCYPYFSAYSVDEEDGSMSPKYYVYTPPHIKRWWIFQGATCNGVLHLMSVDWEHILWNPTTDECKTLPMSFVPNIHLDCSVMASVLASGMWYDHTREDYKLLQILSTGERNYRIWLYSLKSNSWKETPCPDFEVRKPISACNPSACNLKPTSACINGVYYCKASFGPKGSPGIMSFNLSTETFSKIHLPFIKDGNVRYQGLKYKVLEYKGLLSIIVCFPAPIFFPDLVDVLGEYELWVMNDGLWIKESVFRVRGVHEPKWFSKNGRFLYFESFKDEVVVFDRATGKSKNLGIHCYSSELEIYPFADNSMELRSSRQEKKNKQELETGSEKKKTMKMHKGYKK